MREFDLLEHVYRSNAVLGPRVHIPPGDDMGMVELRGVRLLAAVDQLVEGRHVRSGTAVGLIGRKAVARSLSDIAAMAACPVATLAAVVLPPGFGEPCAAALFDAMQQTARAHHAPLIGGDIAIHADAHAPLVCSITVLAEPADHPPVLRSGARMGDGVYVTGELGATMTADGGGHHLAFQPRIELALALSRRLGSRLHAMIDISDGLGRDASHIAERSNVQILIEAQRLPCRTGADQRGAMSDGEDYELLFAAAGEVPGTLDGVPITRVGETRPAPEPGAPRVLVIIDGRTVSGDEMGWQHQA
jgi:thiamine-monophosphate kinase